MTGGASPTGNGARRGDAARFVPAAIRVVIAIAVIAAFAEATHLTPALQLALWNGSRGPVRTFGAETWLAPGSSYIPAGWFGDVLMARAGPLVGLRGAALLSALAYTLALAMTEHRARARGGALFAAVAVLLAMANAIGSFGVGDRLATDTFFTALTLALLDRTGRGRYALAGVSFVWAWLSPDALLGVFFTLAVALGRMFEARISRDETAKEPAELLVLSLASLIATILTPAGYGYVWASLEALHLDGMDVPYTTHPGDIVPLAYHGGFMVLLFLAVIAGGTYGAASLAAFRTRPGANALPAFPGASGAGEAGVLALAIVLAFFDGHLVPVAGIAAGPVLAGAAARRFGIPAVSWVVPLALVAAGVMGILAVVVADGRHRPTRFDPTPLVAKIVADPNAHALYCTQPLWCDGALGSHVRVGLDSRIGWPASAFADQSAIATVGPHWSQILAKGGVDRVVAYRATALAGLLRLEPGWRQVGDDGIAASFARVPSGAGAR